MVLERQVVDYARVQGHVSDRARGRATVLPERLVKAVNLLRS